MPVSSFLGHFPEPMPHLISGLRVFRLQIYVLRFFTALSANLALGALFGPQFYDLNILFGRYDAAGCSYLYNIDAHLTSEAQKKGDRPFVIDATHYGNIARFINHR
jgi:hypothetical protein